VSSFFIIPTIFVDNYEAGIDISPIGSYGAEDEGFEIYNALNSQRFDYAKIYGFSQQPIEISHSNLPFTLPDCFNGNAAMYLKFNKELNNHINSAMNFMDMTLTSGASTVSLVYGDAHDKSGITYFEDIDYNKSTNFSECVSVFDDQYNDKNWTLTLGSEEVDVATYGTEFKLYELMIGYAIAIPEGYVREDVSKEREFFGGVRSTRPFGQPLWSGLNSLSPRISFELTFESLPTSARNDWCDIYAYSRGTFPMMFIEDSSDKTTWKKVRMTGIQESEDAGMHTLVIGFEEV